MTMHTINYIFFEEFKKLEKLCSDIYRSHSGVTHYIDDMKTISYRNRLSIPNWDADLNQLKRLRHIRNTLAHEEDAFNKPICTQNDVEWIRSFYKRILNQSDPLAMQYKASQNHTSTPMTIPKNNKIYEKENPQENSSQSTIIIIFIIVSIVTVLIILMLKSYLWLF